MERGPRSAWNEDMREQLRARGPGRQLDGEQEAAACASAHQPLLMLAGAGSGKTTTLMRRLWHMIVNEVGAIEHYLLYQAAAFQNAAARRLAAAGLAA